ncbi:MAG: redoxin domain-containing protein [Verrucomicrobiota bacterium]
MKYLTITECGWLKLFQVFFVINWLSMAHAELKVGDTIPDNLTLFTGAGASFHFSKVASVQPTVVYFYRGWWCPYAVRQLIEFKKLEKDFMQLGWQLIAISPDQPSYLTRTIKKTGVSFLVLSDRGGRAQKSFGVTTAAKDKLIEDLASNGVSLKEVTGMMDIQLPKHVLFISGVDGEILHKEVHSDYEQLISAERVLDMIKVHRARIKIKGYQN